MARRATQHLLPLLFRLAGQRQGVCAARKHTALVGGTVVLSPPAHDARFCFHACRERYDMDDLKRDGDLPNATFPRKRRAHTHARPNSGTCFNHAGPLDYLYLVASVPNSLAGATRFSRRLGRHYHLGAPWSYPWQAIGPGGRARGCAGPPSGACHTLTALRRGRGKAPQKGGGASREFQTLLQHNDPQRASWHNLSCVSKLVMRSKVEARTGKKNSRLFQDESRRCLTSRFATPRISRGIVRAAASRSHSC